MKTKPPPRRIARPPCWPDLELTHVGGYDTSVFPFPKSQIKFKKSLA
jgi:hypothetical protein